MSNKYLTNNCGILSKLLPGDVILADRGFAIANIRIHVERVIGCRRQKYTILQSTLPITFVTKRVNEEVPILDHIVRVCCGLNNLCDSVVPLE